MISVFRDVYLITRPPCYQADYKMHDMLCLEYAMALRRWGGIVLDLEWLCAFLLPIAPSHGTSNTTARTPEVHLAAAVKTCACLPSTPAVQGCAITSSQLSSLMSKYGRYPHHMSSSPVDVLCIAARHDLKSWMKPT